jgi:hypothetical protein
MVHSAGSNCHTKWRLAFAVLPVFFRMDAHGADVAPDPHVPLTSSNMPAPERMSGPLTSHYLMDMASLLPPLLLGPRPGDRVSDYISDVLLADIFAAAHEGRQSALFLLRFL